MMLLDYEPTVLARSKIVLATGVFDILHPGHVKFLEASKKKGGPGAKLVVVVARDRTVSRRKGRPPIQPEKQRLEIVSSLKTVDKAVLGHQNMDMLRILKQMKPDMITVGYDQQEIKNSVRRLVKRTGLPISVVQIAKFGDDKLNSSTKIKNRIATRWRGQANPRLAP